jgi:hypothetical protein
MKKILLPFLMLALFVLPVSNNKIHAQNLISVEYKRAYTLGQVQSIFDNLGVPPGLTTLPIRFEVRVYKITYHTVAVDSITPTIATGAFFFPVNPVCKISLINYNHGTLFAKSDAPSTLNGEEGKIGVLMATDGYGVVMPDYLGLGDSPGLHPYHHARSEATAVIDMIRACRQAADSINLGLNGQLYITGYSQGGHVTMATQRMIEQHFSQEMNVTATSPMSGAYDLSGVQASVVTSDLPYDAPAYLPYMVMSYRYAYQIYPDINTIFKPPYNTTIPPLFDGNHGEWAVGNATPNPPKQIIDSLALLDYVNDSINNPLRRALKENDVYDWVTTRPMKILYCHGDYTVNPGNAVKAYNKFVQNGCGNLVSMDDLGNSSHYECAMYALIVGKTFFDSFRKLSYIFDSIAGSHSGASDGQASVTIRNGASPFHVLWENGDTTNTSQHLHEGWNKVTINDASNCPVTDSVNISTTTLGINILNISGSIIVYPNPVSDNVILDLSLIPTPVKTIDIVSPEGKMICCRYAPFNTKVIIETSGLNDGIYYIRIRLADETAVYKKIIVIR